MWFGRTECTAVNPRQQNDFCGRERHIRCELLLLRRRSSECSRCPASHLRRPRPILLRRLTVVWKKGETETRYDPVWRKSLYAGKEAQVFSLASRALVDFRVGITH